MNSALEVAVVLGVCFANAELLCIWPDHGAAVSEPLFLRRSLLLFCGLE